jgi:plastocyanin
VGSFEYTLNSQTYTIPFQATSQVPAKPLNPPYLTSPMTGEMCLDESGQLDASGITDSGLLVKLYENNNYISSTTADSSGKFSFKWTSSLTVENPINIYAVVCDPASPANCSAPSRLVRLDYPQAFWCPQRSYWEGNVGSVHYLFHFVNDLGHYATNDFMLPGVHGFLGTQLHLYSCCDRDTNPFTVKADGIAYSPTGHDGRMWNFTIGSAHDVTVQSQCQVGGDKPSHGTILIDPDGFVFDSTEGGQYDSITGMFSPAHALAGVTVTAYVYVEDWNSWIVWPASLYNNQVNPQVTGADGYFAFFTPPGKYYLQATNADGYQTWRSPVIEVIAEIVHANIPLTPAIADQVTQVTLTPDGPSPSSVKINPGETIEWVSTLGASPTLSDLAEKTANPVLRILSSLDPLINILGFDGGRLAPGETFKRQFTREGIYTYSDGAGHTGQVVVGNISIYLPLVQR